VRLTERHGSLLIAGLLLLSIALVTGHPGTARLLERVDLLVYDLLLPLQAPPMSSDITVVAIDDRSIEQLGRWPWDRRLHAELIERLASMDARVIGMDVLFSEPQTDNPEADRRLAVALGSANVVLPVAPRQPAVGELIDELLPIPSLAVAASALGHVDVELDVDGLSRSTYLRGGIGSARWPSFALAVLARGGEAAVLPPEAGAAAPYRGGWVRAEYRLIPFTRPGDGPRTLSYAAVLDGRIDAEAIAGKYVYVGVTAAGLGDALSTPGAFSHERMPGVILNAQVLNGLLQGAMISPLAAPASRLLSFLLAAATCLLLFRTSLRFSAITALAGAAGIVVLAALLLVLQRSWFAPASAIVAILLACLGWTAWRYGRERRLQDHLISQLDHLARHHAATGLPNHYMLERRLRELADSDDLQGNCALLVMHVTWPGSATIVLDRPISDTVLHAIGDRLKAIASHDDFIAHLSGDDFAVLMRGFADTERARLAAAEFLARLQEPMEFEGDTLLLAPQIGVSVWPSDTADPQQLLRNAYTAMFTSRMDDAEHLCIYSASVSSELHQRSQLEQAMAYALERHEFEIHYQPQVSAKSGRIVGVEALLRWNNPILGWISPSAFIPVAEHVGLIRSIGTWVIEETCRQLQEWKLAGYGDLRLAINISPPQFMVPGLEQDIRATIRRTEIMPDFVELEITESSLMRDIEGAVQVMHKLKDFGLKLAIDDFGTGYSSLSSLRHFPLDRLKIDRAFTLEIGRSRDAEEITLTIIAMARQLGLSVLAEGVETQQQAAFLRDNGCDELQGFLYARPMPAEKLRDLLSANRSLGDSKAS
jgi:EAL domain-containing protein (putative c-di-GMP-specific phosphodiesterase class I)/CHASE2 domain-containing sensor protein/GGDEF domain-containing protein